MSSPSNHIHSRIRASARLDKSDRLSRRGRLRKTPGQCMCEGVGDEEWDGGVQKCEQVHREDERCLCPLQLLLLYWLLHRCCRLCASSCRPRPLSHSVPRHRRHHAIFSCYLRPVVQFLSESQRSPQPATR